MSSELEISKDDYILELKDIILQYEQRLSRKDENFQLQFSELQEEILSVTKQNSDLEVKLNELAIDNLDKETLLISKDEAVKILQKNMISQMEDLRKEYDEMLLFRQEEIESLRSTGSQLREQLLVRENDLVQFIQKHEDQMDRMFNEELDKSNLDPVLATLREELKENQELLKQKQKSLEIASIQIEEQDKKIHSFEDALSHHKMKEKQFVQRESDLIKTCEELERKMKDNKKKDLLHKGKVKSLEKQLKDSQIQTAKSKETFETSQKEWETGKARLQYESETLKINLKELTSERDDLNTEKRKIKEHINILTQESSQTDKLEGLHSTITELNSQIESLTGEKLEYQNILANSELKYKTEIDILQNNMNEMEEKSVEIERSNEKLKNEVVESQKLVTDSAFKYEKEIETLLKNMNEMEEKYVEMHKLNETISKENIESQNMHGESALKYEKEIVDLWKNIKEMEDKYEVMRRSNKELNNEIVNSQKIYKDSALTYEEEIENLQRNIKELEEKYREIQRSNEQLNKEKLESQNIHAGLALKYQQEIEYLQKNITEIEQNYVLLQNSNEELSQDNLKLNEEINLLKINLAENKQLTATLEEGVVNQNSSDTLSCKKDALKNILQQKEELEFRIEELREIVADNKSEIGHLKTKLKEKSCNDEVSVDERYVKALLQDVFILIEEHGKLSTRLDNKVGESEKVVENLYNLHVCLSRIESDVKEDIQELSKTKKECAELRAKLEKGEHEYTVLKAKSIKMKAVFTEKLNKAKEENDFLIKLSRQTGANNKEEEEKDGAMVSAVIKKSQEFDERINTMNRELDEFLRENHRITSELQIKTGSPANKQGSCSSSACVRNGRKIRELTDNISVLTQQNGRMNDKMLELQSRITQDHGLVTKVTALHEKTIQYGEEMVRKEVSIQTLQQQEYFYDQDVEILRQELAKCEAKNASYIQVIKELSKDIYELVVRLNEASLYNHSVKVKIQDICDLQNRNKELASRLGGELGLLETAASFKSVPDDSIKSQLENTLDQIARANQILSSVKQSNDWLGSLDELVASHKGLIEETSQLKEQRDVISNKFERLIQELEKECDSEINKLKEENEVLSGQLINYEQNINVSDALKQTISEKEDQLTELMFQLSECTNKNKALTDKLEHLTLEFQESKERIKHQEENNRKLNVEIQELRKQIKTYNQLEITEFQKQTESSQSAIDKLKNENHELTEQVKILQPEIENKSILISQFNKEINTLQSDIDKLMKINNELEEQIKSNQLDIKDSANKNVKLEEQMKNIEQLSNRNEELEEQIKNIKMNYEILANKNEELERKLQHFESDNKLIFNRNTKLEEQVKSIQSNNDKLTKRIEEFKEQMKSSQLDFEQVTNRNEELTERNQNSELTINKLTNEITYLEEIVKTNESNVLILTNENADMKMVKDGHAQALNSIAELNLKNSQLNKEKLELIALNDELTRQYNAMQLEYDEVKQGHNELEKIQEQSKIQFAQLSQELEFKSKKCQELANQNTGLEQSLSNLKNENEAIREQLSVLQLKVNDLTSENALITDDNMTSKLKYEDSLKRIKSDKSKLEEYSYQIKQLTNQLSDLTNKYETLMNDNKSTNKIEEFIQPIVFEKTYNEPIIQAVSSNHNERQIDQVSMEKLNEQLQNKTLVVDRLTENLRELKSQIGIKQDKIQELIDENQYLENILKSEQLEKNRMKVLEREIEELKIRNKELENIIKSEQSEKNFVERIKTQETQIIRLTNENAELLASVTNYKSEIELLKNKNEDLENIIRSDQSEKNYKEQIKSRETEIMKLTNKNAELQASMVSEWKLLQAKNEELESSIRSDQSDNDHSEHIKVQETGSSMLSNENIELINYKSESEQKMRKLESRVRELERQQAESQTLINEFEAVCVEKDNRINSMEREAAEINSQLDQYIQAICSMQVRLEASKPNLQQLLCQREGNAAHMQQVLSIVEELEKDYAQELDAAELVKARLEKKILKGQQTIKRLKKQIRQLQDTEAKSGNSVGCQVEDEAKMQLQTEVNQCKGLLENMHVKNFLLWQEVEMLRAHQQDPRQGPSTEASEMDPRFVRGSSLPPQPSSGFHNLPHRGVAPSGSLEAVSERPRSPGGNLDQELLSQPTGFQSTGHITKEVRDLQKKLSRNSSQLNQLRIERNRIHQEYTKERQCKEEAETALEQIRRQMSEQQRPVQETEQQLRSLNASLEEEITSLKRFQEELGMENADLADQLEIRERRIDVLETKVKKMEIKLTSNRRKYEELLLQLDEKDQYIDQFNDQMRSEVSVLERDKQEFKKETKQLKNTLRTRNEVVDHLQKALESSGEDSKVSSKLAWLRELDFTKGQLDAQKREYKMDLSRKKEEITNLQGRLEELSDENRQLKKKLPSITKRASYMHPETKAHNENGHNDSSGSNILAKVILEKEQAMSEVKKLMEQLESKRPDREDCEVQTEEILKMSKQTFENSLSDVKKENLLDKEVEISQKIVQAQNKVSDEYTETVAQTYHKRTSFLTNQLPQDNFNNKEQQIEENKITLDKFKVLNNQSNTRKETMVPKTHKEFEKFYMQTDHCLPEYFTEIKMEKFNKLKSENIHYKQQVRELEQQIMEKERSIDQFKTMIDELKFEKEKYSPKLSKQLNLEMVHIKGNELEELGTQTEDYMHEEYSKCKEGQLKELEEENLNCQERISELELQIVEKEQKFEEFKEQFQTKPVDIEVITDSRSTETEERFKRIQAVEAQHDLYHERINELELQIMEKERTIDQFKIMNDELEFEKEKYSPKLSKQLNLEMVHIKGNELEELGTQTEDYMHEEYSKSKEEQLKELEEENLNCQERISELELQIVEKERSIDQFKTMTDELKFEKEKYFPKLSKQLNLEMVHIKGNELEELGTQTEDYMHEEYSKSKEGQLKELEEDNLNCQERISELELQIVEKERTFEEFKEQFQTKPVDIEVITDSRSTETEEDYERIIAIENDNVRYQERINELEFQLYTKGCCTASSSTQTVRIMCSDPMIIGKQVDMIARAIQTNEQTEKLILGRSVKSDLEQKLLDYQERISELELELFQGSDKSTLNASTQTVDNSDDDDERKIPGEPVGGLVDVLKDEIKSLRNLICHKEEEIGALKSLRNQLQTELLQSGSQIKESNMEFLNLKENLQAVEAEKQMLSEKLQKSRQGLHTLMRFIQAVTEDIGLIRELGQIRSDRWEISGVVEETGSDEEYNEMAIHDLCRLFQDQMHHLIERMQQSDMRHDKDITQIDQLSAALYKIQSTSMTSPSSLTNDSAQPAEPIKHAELLQGESGAMIDLEKKLQEKVSQIEELKSRLYLATDQLIHFRTYFGINKAIITRRASNVTTRSDGYASPSTIVTIDDGAAYNSSDTDDSDLEDRADGPPGGSPDSSTIIRLHESQYTRIDTRSHRYFKHKVVRSKSPSMFLTRVSSSLPHPLPSVIQSASSHTRHHMRHLCRTLHRHWRHYSSLSIRSQPRLDFKLVVAIYVAVLHLVVLRCLLM